MTDHTCALLMRDANEAPCGAPAIGYYMWRSKTPSRGNVGAWLCQPHAAERVGRRYFRRIDAGQLTNEVELSRGGGKDGG